MKQKQNLYYRWTRGHTQLFWDEKDINVRHKLLDDFYRQTFGTRETGSFCEVGAHNGIDCGITLPLADRGWTGLYIEPSPHWAQVCANNHECNPNVRTLNVAIGPGRGTAVLHGTDAGATVSVDYLDNVCSRLPWTGNHSVKQSVQMMTLNDALTLAQFAPNFDVLSVDVEGYEQEVFSGFDLNKWKPKVMLVEMADNHPDMASFAEHLKKYQQLRQMFLDNGYVEVHKDEVNSLFVRNE